MTFGVELAVVTGRDNDRAVLDAALSLARRFDSHIEVLHPSLDPATAVPIGAPFGRTLRGLMGNLRQESDALAAKARETFEAWRSAGKLEATAERRGATPSTNWQEMRGEPGEAVTFWGRLADLIVAGASAENDLPGTAMILEAALFRSGRPVVFVPRPVQRDVGANIAILWDGGAQAARAVGDALPMLRRAQRVLILSCGPTKKGPDAARLAAHLKWRGIDTSANEMKPGRSDAGEALVAEAADWGCDLLVMGAYGHSRMRELVLGGVTRHVLQNARIPVLMSH